MTEDLAVYQEHLKDEAAKASYLHAAAIDSLARRIPAQRHVENNDSVIVPIALFVGGFALGSIATIAVVKYLD